MNKENIYTSQSLKSQDDDESDNYHYQDSVDLPTLKNVHPEFIQAKERLIKLCQ
jgi:hypothetical protein